MDEKRYEGQECGTCVLKKQVRLLNNVLQEAAPLLYVHHCTHYTEDISSRLRSKGPSTPSYNLGVG